jgi:hypothetical protein
VAALYFLIIKNCLMAKKRSKSKKSGRRRSRVGAMALKAENPLVKYGSIALGFLAAKPINEGIDKLTGTSIDGKIIAGGQVGVGALLLFKKGKKSLIGTVAGGVMIGAGAKRAMTAFGIGDIVAGFQSIPAVAGYQSLPAVNGSRRLMNGSHTSLRPSLGANYGLNREGVGR